MSVAPMPSARQLLWPSLRRVLRVLAVVLLLMYASACALLSASQLARRSSRRWLPEHAVTMHRALLRILSVRVHGGVAWPRGLLLCNHISWLDIIVLGARGRCCFVAKSDVRQWPLIGALVQATGNLFVQRHGAQMMKNNAQVVAHMRQQLLNGERVLLFPEGTCSLGNDVLPYRARLLTALPSEQSITPCLLRYRGPGAEAIPYVGDDEFLSHLWRLLLLDSIDAELYLLPDIRAMNPRDTAETAWRMTRAKLQELDRSEQVRAA